MFSHGVVDLRVVYEESDRIRSYDSIRKEDCVK